MLQHIYRFLHLTSLSWSQTLQTTKLVISVNVQCCWPTNSIYTCISLTVSHPVMACEIWHASHPILGREIDLIYAWEPYHSPTVICWESELAALFLRSTSSLLLDSSIEFCCCFFFFAVFLFVCWDIFLLGRIHTASRQTQPDLFIQTTTRILAITGKPIRTDARSWGVSD